jgi:hypothetical protein
MLRGVTSVDISAFIGKISIPRGEGVNKRFDCTNLSAYIAESKLFPEWDVVIATGDSNSTVTIQNHEIHVVVRTFRLGASDENYIRMGGHNNRIIDPGIFDSGVQITAEQKQKILSNKAQRRADKPTDQLTATDWLKLRECPLLAIYFIDLKIDDKNLGLSERDKYVAVKEDFGTDTLIGFAVGFPKKEAKELLTYRGNLIKANEVYADEEEFDEEELSDE